MLHEIDDKRAREPRAESAARSLCREILIDVAMTAIGTGLVALAIILAAQGLSIS
jgi:hypothetical protein